MPEPDTSTRLSSMEEILERGRHAASQGELPAALALLAQALEQDDQSWEAWRLKGLVHLRLGQPAAAMADLERAMKGHAECAVCHHELGVARLRAGHFDLALGALERALELDQKFAEAHATQAAALLRLQRKEEALQAMDTAILLEPADAGLLHNRAVVLTALGMHEKAAQDYERVLQLNPHSGGTLNNLAWLLATAPDSTLRDGPRARALAMRAVAVGTTGAWLDTLAAAHAECGDFQAAIKIETEALEKSHPPNPAFRERINIYREQMTYAEWRTRRAAPGGSSFKKEKAG